MKNENSIQVVKFQTNNSKFFLVESRRIERFRSLESARGRFRVSRWNLQKTPIEGLRKYESSEGSRIICALDRRDRYQIWSLINAKVCKCHGGGTKGRDGRGGGGDSFNYTVCFTPDVRSARAVLLFSNNFPCNSAEREPIKVQARDLASRQEPVPRVYKWVSGKLIWNLARKYAASNERMSLSLSLSIYLSLT